MGIKEHVHADPGPALQKWVEDYRASVGPAAEGCIELLRELQKPKVLGAGGQQHLLELLTILSSLSPDPITVSCAMVLAAEQSSGDLADLRPRLRPAVTQQLTDLHQLRHFAAGQDLSATERSAEGLRRLLLALVKDVRVVLVDLAWQLVLLRRAQVGSEQALNLAKETALIHAPLANRLGVWQLKWQLEDLAFRFQEPEQYQKITSLVAERREEREDFISGFMQKLSTALADAGISAQLVLAARVAR